MSKKDPELVVVNGVIETLVPNMPQVNAFSVREGRVANYDNKAIAEIGPETHILDLDGGFAMPGFIDIHNHHAMAGEAELHELVLPRGATLPQILAYVREHALAAGPDEWVVGGCWESHLMSLIDDPEALRQLDEAAAGRPVMLRDDTLHNRWVNSRALALGEIDRETPDPSGGVIRRSPDGQPTGVMLESGGLLIEKVMASLRIRSEDSHKQASRRAIEMLNSFGVTAFQDAATSLPQMQALASLDMDGDLNAWVVSSMLCNDFIFGHDPLGEGIIAEREDTFSLHHRPTFIKLFLDGVPASRTAAFLEPYLPDVKHGSCFHGATTMGEEELYTWLNSTARRGISAKVHCTGDAAVRMFLDAVERVRKAGHDDVIYHLAHGQLIAETDIPRLAELNVVVDASPPLWYPTPISEATAEVLPNNRADFIAPNRSFLESGALIAGGSDWPVCEEPNVWESIYGLVTRKDPKKRYKHPSWPEQAITLEQAISAYTTDSAKALGLEGLTGSLGLGHSADFITLSDNPYLIEMERLLDLRVQQTWFEGRKVFDLMKG